jgi:HEAT repeat protein
VETDSWAKAFSAIMLGRTGCSDAEEELRKALNSSDSLVKASSIIALSDLGSEYIKGKLKAIYEERPGTDYEKVATVYGMIKFGNKDYENILTGYLKNDDSFVRGLAALCMEELSMKEKVPAIREALDREDAPLSRLV